MKSDVFLGKALCSEIVLQTSQGQLLDDKYTAQRYIRAVCPEDDNRSIGWTLMSCWVIAPGTSSRDDTGRQEAGSGIVGEPEEENRSHSPHFFSNPITSHQIVPRGQFILVLNFFFASSVSYSRFVLFLVNDDHSSGRGKTTWRATSRAGNATADHLDIWWHVYMYW